MTSSISSLCPNGQGATPSDDKVARTVDALTLLYAPTATMTRPRRTRQLRPPVLEALAVDEQG